MNQILMVEDKKKKKNKSSSRNIEINNIVRFFAIAIIVFGLTIIGHSSYGIYIDSKGNNTKDLPKINVTRVNDTLLVEVESKYIIDKFKYSWLNSEQTSIHGGSTTLSEEIILPSENNALTMVVEDETGRAITYTKEIVLDNIDIIKPQVSIEKGAGSIIIRAKDETKIEYITYKIDEGEEIRIDKNNEEDKTIEYAVTDMERGEHTIYATAVDSFGNIATAEAPILVSSDKPTIKKIDIDRESGKIIIEASDVDGIASIEVNLNGAVYNLTDINKTEATFSLNLKEGNNTLSIKLTNVNGLVAEGATEFTYAK